MDGEAHDCDGAAFGFAGRALWFGSRSTGAVLRGLATKVRDDGEFSLTRLLRLACEVVPVQGTPSARAPPGGGTYRYLGKEACTD